MSPCSRRAGVAPGLFAAVLLLCTVGCGGGTGSGVAADPPATTTARAQAKPAALTQDEACLDGDPACTPTGAHAAHAGFDCKVCHKVAGRLSFDASGPAYAAGKPAPTFDAVAKTCSNVACHGVPAGTFTYSSWDWALDQPVTVTVSYGGTSSTTPYWYSTGVASCTACHDNPPRNGSTGSNVWHSGSHAGQDSTGAANQCQLCHPDATGVNGQGTAITDPTLHANGVVNVQAAFTTTCFSCH